MMIKITNIGKRAFLLFLSLFAISTAIYSQSLTITGTVIDKNNEGLIGVTVVVKDTPNVGTITDFDGKYEITVPDKNSILSFAYIGYEPQDIKVGDRKIVNVTLTESSIALDQVVIVGYGQQKKVNLTGAVSAITMDEAITGRSIANASTALQGLVPGLTVTQSSGMAGNNSAELLIRGIGTINNASPLIVVDDMPDVDINRLNMDDIESISVLKDATASSVYGSRAANGVILIKTKSGKGLKKTKINFSGSFGWEKPTKTYDFLTDYAKALSLHRTSQAATSMLETDQNFHKGTIEQWMALSLIDDVRYPSTDWWDIVIRDGSMQNYNVSASGGNEVSNFYSSIGYMKQEGLQINNDYDRYNVRFNYDYKVAKNVNTGFRLDGNWSDFTYALQNGFTTGNSSSDMQYAVAGIYPYDPVLDVYGSVMALGEDPTAINPLELYTNHLKRQERQELNGSFYIDWEPIKGLVARLDYGMRYYDQSEKEADMPGKAYNFQTGQQTKWYVGQNAGIFDRARSGYKTLMNFRLNYNTIIAEAHSLGAMFVYSEEYWKDKNLDASRLDRLHPSLSEIDGALTSVIGNAGKSETEGLRSYIGRVNYSAFDKYLLELNFRVDGSSKFQPGHQYGFFPSAALGWRFSEEAFVKKYTNKWMDSGKFRFSYGSLGNNIVVGRTEQQEVLDGNHYMLDGSIAKGFIYRRMLNENLTWESTKVFNAGLDLVLLGGRLSAEIDYYDRLTKDMIQPSKLSIHLSGAYNPPRENIGELRNRGIEGNFTWRDHIKDFNYSVNLNVSYNRSKLEKWSEYLGRGYEYGGKRVFLDMPYDYVYTYLDYGIIQSYADAYNNVPQWAAPGDILREDVNGDGRVDDNDKVVMENYQRGMPTTNFGMNIQMSWKGIDLSMLFQGTAGRKDYWLNNYKTLNLSRSRYASTTQHWTEPWTWDNRSGSWPRLGGLASNQTESAFWLDNLSYLRMKNLMIGYTLPAKWTRKFFVDNLRIYGSMENLFTWTKYRGLDPEKTNRGDMYPMTKSYTIGINVGF